MSYAEEICAIAEVTDPRVRDAFASVPREHFLGPGPWMIAQPFNREEPYRRTATADPSEIQQDVLVGIDLARQLNNGQPSAHARWIAAAVPHPKDQVLHVGAGVGYYTAILAELCGPEGKVRAVEADPELATRATKLLTRWPNVTVECSDASKVSGPYDLIYVNAGCTRPRDEWLDALSPTGRLLVPLTVHLPMLAEMGAAQHGAGAVFVFQRGAARFVSPVGIFDCLNARRDEDEPPLMKLLDFETASRISRISREPHQQAAGCVVHLDRFCLS